MNALYAAPVWRPQIPGRFHKTVRLKFRVADDAEGDGRAVYTSTAISQTNLPARPAAGRRAPCFVNRRCHERSRPDAGERVRGVHFSDETLAVDLADGPTIIVPLVW